MQICENRKRILACNEHLLVSGGPGSGKTTIALLKALRRIEEGIALGQEVLFLSFSRAAVARILQASKIVISRPHQSSVQIQTFHSFFWQILRTHGYLLGSAKKLSLLLPHEERVLNNGLKRGDDMLQWQSWEIERSRLFQEKGKVAFDLFASKANELLSRSKILCRLYSEHYPLIIVDEAQDTAPDQWACIQLLAKDSQILCLADLEQQIFDFIPGVGPERIDEIRLALKPLEISLGQQNNRSPNADIAKFANDFLHGKRTLSSYKGISELLFNPKAEERDNSIRKVVGILNSVLQKETGRKPESIAILTTFDRGALLVSNALRNGNKAIPHKILFDETSTLLSSRFLAFLLEPKLSINHELNLCIALGLITDVFRAKGGNTTSKAADKISKAALSIGNGGKIPKTKLCSKLDNMISELESVRFTGDPRQDWMTVRTMLRVSGVTELISIDRDLQYMMTFNRGKHIAGGLSEIWIDSGRYLNARQILDNALATDQILAGEEDLTGIHVMTMHKSKGKQFDGVILFQAENFSPFLWPGDVYPYTKSRKLVRVGITRSKIHTIILKQMFPTCPILSSFKI